MANVNDASAVQALLAQLRASQALQAAIGTPAPAESNDSGSSQVPDNLPHPPIEPADAVDEQANGASATSERPSVASLLSQLQSSSAIQAALAVEFPAVQGLPVTVNTAYAPQPSAQPTDPRLRGRTHSESAAHKQDLRNASFQQALPGIAQLSEDQAFVDAVRKLKSDQVLLEKRLWEERQAIQKRHEERVKVARTKASMIGVSLTKFEADSLTDAFRRELQQFDRERVLPAWDGLVTKQQSALESLEVPTMFPTAVSTDRQKQQRVIQVLNGVAD